MAMTQEAIEDGGTDYIRSIYIRPKSKGISPQNMARNMVQYLHIRILEFPLNSG